MKRSYVLYPLLALVALLAAGAARAETLVTLRPTLEVDAETISMSDLFDGVPGDADVAIGRAPTPGAALSIDPEWLQRRALALGLDWPNLAGARRVTVRRRSQTMSAEDLASLVARELSRTMGAEMVVSVTSTQALHAPTEVLLAPEVMTVAADPTSNSFTAEISLAEGLSPVRVTGRAERALELPVLVRSIARGDVVTADDLAFVTTPASRSPADALSDPDAIIGMAARRALRSGAPLKPFDLERPAVIARGEVIVVRFERGPLLLTARARALADVAEGEQARFVNLQSNRVIEAVAVAPGEAWLVASAPTAGMGGLGGLP